MPKSDYRFWILALIVIISCGDIRSEDVDSHFDELQDQVKFIPKGECDSISSSYLLRCISPLLQSDRYQLHPPLYARSRRSIDNSSRYGNESTKDICNLYAEYKTCAPAELRQRCRNIAYNAGSVYDYICSNSEIIANLSSESSCMTRMDADALVTTCERNAATALRHVAATLAVSIEKRHKMQCDVVQKYVDCARKKYVKECGVSVWLIKGKAMELSTVTGDLKCNFTILEPPAPDYSKPICKPKSQCTCYKGYEFDNRDTNLCVDTDECAQSIALCSQRCENTIGSYVCSCDDRYYELAPDGHSCVAKAKNEKPYIFFAHGQSLWNISMDGKDFQLQRAGLQKTAMLDIDVQDRMIYYVDIGANKLERIRFEGVFPQTLQSFDLEGTEGVGVDWIGKKLYTVKGTNMYVQELDGRFRHSLYKDVFKLPRALAIHSPLGIGFATDWGANAFIARASLDGTDFRRIVTTGLVWPNGLTIDYYGEKLYWADAFLDIIECSKLDGSQRKTVLHDSNSVPHPFGLAIMGDHVYWTDWTYRGILRANKNTGENVTVVAQTALLPYGIKIYYSALQPEGQNSCGSNNGGCSQLCLLSPSITTMALLSNGSSNGTNSQLGHKCVCADGFQLDADGKTCVSRCNNKEILCQGSDPKCISKIYWCDGVVHCRDSADERDCPPRMCFASEFQCHSNKTCIATSKVCDGTKQCEDGSDESYC